MSTKNYSEIEDTLTIGQVSNLAGVNRETLRYYERKGIIDLPARKDSGYRIYPLETVKRIRFIKRAQTLGFSLKEITELIALQNNADGAICRDVKKYAKDKVKKIEMKLADLNQMHSRLRELIAVCDEGNSLSACPILDAFEVGSKNED